MAVPALPSGYALQEYRIERLLGAGGFGLTYLAIDTNLNLRVAIKEYLPSDIAVRNPDQSVAPNSTQSGEDFMWGSAASSTNRAPSPRSGTRTSSG
jgi:serine/threonine protein kinase